MFICNKTKSNNCMKKLAILFLGMILTVSAVYSNNIINLDGEENERVEIETETDNSERDRSLLLVGCFLNRESNTIELEYAGIGTPVVYIYDYMENICNSRYGTPNYGKVVLDLPSVEGIYQIVVQSSVYRGTGTFIVH